MILDHIRYAEYVIQMERIIYGYVWFMFLKIVFNNSF